MSRHLDLDLDHLRTLIVRMGSLVEDQVDYAVKAVIDGDPSLARFVIERDAKVDEFDNEIDCHCMNIFALAQPVAVDLRLLMAALKINNELERIGDIAVDVARHVEPLMQHSEFLRTTPLQEMAQASREMMRWAIESFVDSDPWIARRVLRSDAMVDRLDKETSHAMTTIMRERRECAEVASRVVLLSRHLERLADHATNIAEDVIFLVEAKIIKHQYYDVEPDALSTV